MTYEGAIICPGRVAAAIGKGLVAGVVGTAAMTVSSTLEAKVRGRPASTSPARAAGKFLGVAPQNPEAEKRFNSLVHWGYGTGWGVVRDLLAVAGLRAVPAGVAHLVVVWAAEQVVLPATEVSPPATEWEPTKVAIDLWHHVVYAAATGLANRWLDRR